MGVINIEFNKSDIDRLSKRLKAMNEVRFDAVVKKNITQIFNRARQPGGTPVDTGELRKSSSYVDDEMGYIAEYAPHVEYGHRTVNGGFVPGQHFLQKNVDIQKPIFRKDLLDAIKKG